MKAVERETTSIGMPLIGRRVPCGRESISADVSVTPLRHACQFVRHVGAMICDPPFTKTLRE